MALVCPSRCPSRCRLLTGDPENHLFVLFFLYTFRKKWKLQKNQLNSLFTFTNAPSRSALQHHACSSSSRGGGPERGTTPSGHRTQGSLPHLAKTHVRPCRSSGPKARCWCATSHNRRRARYPRTTTRWDGWPLDRLTPYTLYLYTLAHDSEL